MKVSRIGICLSLLLILVISQTVALANEKVQTDSSQTDGPFDVIRIVDGDTIVLSINEKNATVRLIGVDTPETVHPQKQVEVYGREASEFMKNLLKGEQVTLEYEPGLSNLDKYGRLLAYVYRYPDGLFVNLEIVRQGYGHAYTKYPFEHMESFRSYEKKARETTKGLWAPEQSAKVTAKVSVQGTLDTKAILKGFRQKYPEYDDISDIKLITLLVNRYTTSGQPTKQKVTSQPKSEQDVTVYITRTGKKYHRAGCRYLSKSKIPISLREAKSRYGPCSVCGPPR